MRPAPKLINDQDLNPASRTGNSERNVESRSFLGRTRGFLREFSKSWTGMVGLGILLFFVMFALSAPLIGIDPEQLGAPYFSPQPPGPGHILGTDEYGRDVFARLAYGTGVSLMECFVSLGISLSVGLVAGCLAGYFDHKFSFRLIDRLAEVLLAIPIFLLILAAPLRIVVESVPLRTAITTGLWSWGITEKLVRPQALVAKGNPYVEYARASGAGHLHILWRHILPACVSPVLTGLAYTVVVSVGIQTAVDYIGWERNLFSIDEVRIAPYISWGTILSFGIMYSGGADPLSRWWITTVPAACIALLTISLVLIAERMAVVVGKYRSQNFIS